MMLSFTLNSVFVVIWLIRVAQGTRIAGQYFHLQAIQGCINGIVDEVKQNSEIVLSL